MVRGGVDLSRWRQFIDDFGKIFSQELRGLRLINPHFGCERAHLPGPEHFLNLIAGDWLVFFHADPGSECVPLAALREFIHQALEAAALLEEAAQDPDELISTATGSVLSAHGAEYRVK